MRKDSVMLNYIALAYVFFTLFTLTTCLYDVKPGNLLCGLCTKCVYILITLSVTALKS